MNSLALIIAISLVAAALVAFYIWTRAKDSGKPKLEAMREWPC